MDLDELKTLIDAFLLTLPDGERDAFEEYDTPQAHAFLQLGPFYEWACARPSFRPGGNGETCSPPQDAVVISAEGGTTL